MAFDGIVLIPNVPVTLTLIISPAASELLLPNDPLLHWFETTPDPLAGLVSQILVGETGV